MKVWLDDKRSAPRGWRRCYTVKQIIDLLKTGDVNEISLDHDIGDKEEVGEGHDVLLWIEERVFNHGFTPPKINIHTANTAAGDRMRLAVRNIERLAAERRALR